MRALREVTVPDGEVSAVEYTTLADLARDHALDLTRFAYLLCGDRSRAEDLVQDVFLSMHRRFGLHLTIDNPLAYARRAIANSNVSWLRKKKNSDIPTDALPERGIHDLDPTDGDPLWKLLDGLPLRQRAVLVLRYHYGCPDGEIADILRVRSGTVRSLASRALSELRASTDGIPS